MAKITLINPAHLELKLNYSSISHPPLGLCYIASYMRAKSHQVQIIDAVSEAIDKRVTWPNNKNITIVGLGIDEIIDRISSTTDIIGITCMFTPFWPYVRELVKSIKKNFRDVPLVMGGEHVSSAWELILRTSPVDFCVLGEGEITFEKLVDALINNSDVSSVKGIAYRSEDRLIANEPRPRIDDLDALPTPAWDLIDIEKYMEKKLFMGASRGRSMPIIATRGCPYQCRFCTATNMWKRRWIPRSAKRVVDEMEFYINKYDANDFQLMDLTAIVRRDWIADFAREIIERKLKISWQLPVGTRTLAIDREVAHLLMKSGCTYIAFAPESGSKKILNTIKKDIDTKQLETPLKAALNSKMITCLFFIIGFPDEEMEDIKKTFRLIRKMAFLGVHEIAISTFIPIPGSAIFEELKLKDPERFEIDDEFCYSLFSSLSLNKTISWDAHISNGKLLWLRLYGLAMFYSISYFTRPWRLIRLLINLFKGRQETRVDRVLREMLYKLRCVS